MWGSVQVRRIVLLVAEIGVIRFGGMLAHCFIPVGRRCHCERSEAISIVTLICATGN